MGAAVRAAVVAVSDLDPGLVLTPQRYLRTADDAGGTPLGDLVTAVRRTVGPAAAADHERVVLLDTSHARSGVLDDERALVPGTEVRSAKKPVEPGDVIVSRLRPYLRQVARLDVDPGVPVLASTEFHVLRSTDGGSIAFLVAWLLTDEVQQALADAQEGGHHPRVSEEVLLRLVVPAAVLERRTELDALVVAAAAAARESRRLLRVADAAAGGQSA